MALHPEIQKKAQIIVDAALCGRMPTFADYARIPYVEALIEETLRWKPPVLLALPHSALQDDHYEGYAIPKGAIVITNLVAVFSDETVYGAATDEFRPERFLHPDGSLNTAINSAAVFGYGRRQCTGMGESPALGKFTEADHGVFAQRSRAR